MEHFKFNIGDKVQHKACGYNGIVMSRGYQEDTETRFRYYDVGIWESSPPTEMHMVPEIHLKEGHRIE